MARTLLEKTIAAHPTDREAIYDLGVAYGREALIVGETDTAAALPLAECAEYYDFQAFALRPNDPGPLNTAGLVFDDLADVVVHRDLLTARALWKRARRPFQKAMDLLPAQHGAANNMGITFADEAKALDWIDFPEAERLRAEAATWYRQALAIKPDKANAEMNWGNLLADEAEYYAKIDVDRAFPLWAEAAKRYARALADDAKYSDAYYSWGTTEETYASYLADRDLSGARELWHHAVALLMHARQLAPEQTGPLINLAAARVDEAIAVAKKDPAAAQELFDSAIATAEVTTQADEEREAAFRVLGWGLGEKAASLASTDLASARLFWRQADAAFQHSVDTKLTDWAVEKWAEVLHDEAAFIGRTDAASARPIWEACYEKCVLAARLSPQWIFPHRLWGDGLYLESTQVQFIDPVREQALLEQACAQFAQSAKIAPLTRFYKLQFGQAEYELGRRLWENAPTRSLELWHAADDNYRSVLERNPRDVYVRGLRLTALEALGEVYIRSDRERGRTYLLQAVMYGREAFRTSELDATSARYLAKSLDVLASQGPVNREALWDEAIEYLRRALADSPDNSDLELEWASGLAHRSLALMASDPDRADQLWQEAEKHFARAAALDRASPIVYGQWGHELLNMGDYAKALKRPNAIAFWQQSVERCREAVKRTPGDAVGAINLAVSLMRQFVELGSTRTEFLDEARAALLRADPEHDGLTTYNLACVAALRNDTRECVGWLVKSSATSGRADRHLVDTDPYLANVRESAAYKAWYAARFPASAQSAPIANEASATSTKSL